MTKEEKISKINSILQDYFANPFNPRKVAAKDMMDDFICGKVFTQDLKNGKPIRDFLRDLDGANELYSIPYVFPERKNKNTKWFFVALSNEGTIVKGIKPSTKTTAPCQKTAQKGGRTKSDEYYVISLCNEVLGMTALQQHKFPFLTGDTGAKLPVDAYYPELNLVVEYHERQHTEQVKFFDKKETVSGVSRGEQRKIYDERRRVELPKHGIKLVIISYSDFGNTKKLRKNHDADIAIVRKILSVL